MDLADYFREEIEQMEKDGKTADEIERRLASMDKIQQLVILAQL